MRVGIVGLGLIGGSMARAFAKSGASVYAAETDESILQFAKLSAVVDNTLDDQTIPLCDLILLCVYPEGSAQWLEDHVARIQKNTLVLDCCGIKREICVRCFPIAQKFGFTFVGGHPMAGLHYSGFKYSRSNLFQGAPMVLVPPRYDDIELLQRVKDALAPCNFGSFSVTTAEEHDKLIAFTSQMPHIVSNAYIKSPTALLHRGFSAGSYKDMTRVAWLNAQMWAELCMENADNVIFELDCYLDSLRAYREALANGDLDKLTTLLAEGKRRKEEIDG